MSAGPITLLRALGPHLRARSGQFAAAIATLVPMIAVTTAQPLLLKALVDDAILPRNTRIAIALVAVLATLLFVEAASEFANRLLLARLAIGVTNDLRLGLFAQVQRMPLRAGATTGEVVSQFASDVDSVERVLMNEMRGLLLNGITTVVGAIVLLVVRWQLALAALALIPLVYISQRILGARDDQASAARQADAAGIVVTVQETVASQPVVRAFGLQAIMATRFLRDLAALARSTMRSGRIAALQGASFNGSGALLMTTCMGIGTWLALNGQLTVGALFAFFELLWWMVAAVQQMSDYVLPLQYAAAAMQRIDAALQATPAVIDDAHARPAPRLADAIRFDHVTFSYAGNELHRNLDDVTLEIPARSKVAIVGPSGCGKSTLINLLMRFDDPQRGAIKVDGVDLKTMRQISWRSHIGVVFQDSFLFNATIGENIRMGEPAATDRAIATAARDAEIDQSIETPVGEGGRQLSGGQRQRVAIARAIVRNPAILVLDEATSALDPQTEAAINATLERLSAGRTVITITHRLPSIVGADRIFVLNRGRVVEQGTHRELMARAGDYAKSFQRQTGFELTGDGRRATVDIGRLRDVPLFEPLDDRTLAGLASRFVTRRYEKDEIVFRQGDEGDQFHIVVRGRIEIRRGEQRIAVLQDGDFFGEIALLADVPRTATAEARVPTVVLSLAREHFNTLIAEQPAVRKKFESLASVRRQQMLTLV